MRYPVRCSECGYLKPYRANSSPDVEEICTDGGYDDCLISWIRDGNSSTEKEK